MSLPDFLVIGAPRAGTTALYHVLRQHPQIYMSPLKEPRFFAYEGQTLHYRGPGDESFIRTAVTQIDAYQNLFAGAEGFLASGEISPVYMTLAEQASARIQHYLPQARLVAILRHPADRAYSNYLRLVRDGREHLPFAQALAQEQKRKEQNWSPPWWYTRRGFYAAQLKHYFGRFERQQMRFYPYEQWTGSPRDLLDDLLPFLGVDPHFACDLSRRENEAVIPVNRLLYNLLQQRPKWLQVLWHLLPQAWRPGGYVSIKRRITRRPPPLDLSIRSQLTRLFREDILETQDLTGLNLSGWLTE